jgi:uncharacterized protein (DUF488 family)
MDDVVYTIGYQGRSIDQFIALALHGGVQIVVDVRETAWSHKPGFSRGPFEAALAGAGIEYVHAQFAGNPKWIRELADDHADLLTLYSWYLDEHAEVMDALDHLLGQALAARMPPALVCFERHAGDCHRSVLTERWAARGERRVVVHLAIDGLPRLVGT